MPSSDTLHHDLLWCITKPNTDPSVCNCFNRWVKITFKHFCINSAAEDSRAAKCWLPLWNIWDNYCSCFLSLTAWQVTAKSHLPGHHRLQWHNLKLTQNVLVAEMKGHFTTGLQVPQTLNGTFPKQNIFLSFQPLCLGLSQRLQEAFHYETTSPTGIGREELTNLTQSSLSGKLISRLALL